MSVDTPADPREHPEAKFLWCYAVYVSEAFGEMRRRHGVARHRYVHRAGAYGGDSRRSGRCLFLICINKLTYCIIYGYDICNYAVTRGFECLPTSLESTTPS